jgi:hypothetical protein
MLIFRARAIFPLLCMLVVPTMASAQPTQSVTLSWDANSEPTVTGYTLYWGTAARTYIFSRNVGNVTTYTVTGLAPDQKYYFALAAYTASGLASDQSSEVSNDALIVQTGGLLTDQRPGIFWHNQTTGQLATWHLSGPNVIDTRKIGMGGGIADTHWKVAGIGDLNGDGFPDILWRHDTEGWLAVWYLQYNQVVGTYMLSIDKLADPNWQIKGLGDVDGDGMADIVWQHTDGTLAVWFMRGITVASTRLLSIPKVNDPKWQIAGVVDANGDGMADIIWQDSTPGSGGWLAVWFLQGSNVIGTEWLSINRMPDTDWRIESAGYFDGSGRPALVWRHRTQGWVAVWYLQGSQVVGTYLMNPAKVLDEQWKIVGNR